MRPFEGMATVLYARVSTDDKDQDPKSQLHILRKEAKKQGMLIVGEYSDESTGRNMERPGFEKMMGRIMLQDDVNIIFCLDNDRISRSMEDKPKMLAKLKPYNVVIRYLADLSATPETEEGMVMDNMKTYGSQKYVSSHSLKIKAGQSRAREEGTRSGNPIGRPTAFIDLDIAMECADKRYSISQTAELMGVGRETLRRKLIQTERIAEFYERVEKAGGCNSNHRIVKNAGLRYQRSKTPMPENTVCLYPNGQNGGGSE